MSASDDLSRGREALYRRGVAFLKGARTLPELSPAQIDRIERRLERSSASASAFFARRPFLTPALAALAVVVLLTGAAFAVAGRDLTRLPGVGRLLGALFAPPPPRPVPGKAHGPRSDQPAEPPSPTAAAIAIAPPAPGSDGAPAPRAQPPLPAAQPAPASSEIARATPRTATRSNPRGSGTPAEAAALRAPASAAEREHEGAPKTPPPATAATQPPAVPAGGSGPEEASGIPSAPPSPPPAARAPTPPLAAPVAPPPPAAASESPIVVESRSFGAALERWHRDHDANAALAALDAHERRFPHGQIRLEAQILRAEILLAGGRDRDGLALLDAVALAGVPRARELRTVRGELRIKYGRCVEGKADLGDVLAQGISDALARRARQALSNCP